MAGTGTWGISKKRKCLGISVVSFGFSTAGRSQVAETIAGTPCPCSAAVWTLISRLAETCESVKFGDQLIVLPKLQSCLSSSSLALRPQHLILDVTSRLFQSPLFSFHSWTNCLESDQGNDHVTCLKTYSCRSPLEWIIDSERAFLSSCSFPGRKLPSTATQVTCFLLRTLNCPACSSFLPGHCVLR